MSYRERTNRWTAALWTAIGLVAIALPLHALLNDLRTVGWLWSSVLLRLPFLAVGVGFFVYGASRFYSHRHFTLRKEEVECDAITMGNRVHWKESARKYEGLLKQIKYYSGGRAGRSKLYYEVILKHADPSKSVVLFRSYSWRTLDETWRRFSKSFGVPALQKTTKGLIKLPSREVDAKLSLTDLAAWVDPVNFQFSNKVKVVAEPGVYELKFRDRLGALPHALGCFGFATIAYWTVFRFGPLWAAALVLLTLRAAQRAAERAFGWEVIRLSPSGVEHNRETAWGVHPVDQLPAELITNCLLRQRRGWQKTTVVIEAGGNHIGFGYHLPLADQKRIRDLTILVLSQGPSRLDMAS